MLQHDIAGDLFLRIQPSTSVATLRATQTSSWPLKSLPESGPSLERHVLLVIQPGYRYVKVAFLDFIKRYNPEGMRERERER